MRALIALLSRTTLFLALLPVPALAAAEAAAPSFKVVVHPSNPVSRMSRADLADIFLGNKSRWAAGGPVEPIDLSATSPTRRDFSLAIVGLPVSEVVRHWQRLMFSGRGVPPRVKLSDAEMGRDVATRPNAIGYVSASADLSGLKVLTVD